RRALPTRLQQTERRGLREPAGLRLLWVARGALSDCRRPAYSSRPARLRVLYLGHSRRAFLRSAVASPELFDRSARDGCDPGRREEALQGALSAHRLAPTK